MLISKGVPTPMLPSEKSLLDGGEKVSPEDTTSYQSVVGALQYLSLHVLIYPSVSIEYVSSCPPRLLYIGRQSNDFSIIYMTLLIWACVLQSPTLIC